MDNHCPDLVRQYDKDRFLATLFAPEDRQPDLFALYAFNAEVCRVRDVVSEPQIGEIRLQWWQDAIQAIFRGETQDHPVAARLASATAKCSLLQAPLANLIEAHRFDLYADQMPSLSDLEGYLGETSSALIQLACQILSSNEAHKATEAAGLAGVAYGIARLLTQFPRQANLLPRDMQVSDLVSHARKRREEALARIAGLPESLRPAFLPAALTELYLRAAEHAGPKLQTHGCSVPQWRRQWALWRASRQ
jgi:15-cis-phytoene synthase